MSDPFTDFMMSRDPARVMAEGTITIESAYADMPDEVRGVVDAMPVGVLRQRIAIAEAALRAAERRPPKIVRQLVGNRELMKALRDAQSEVRQLRERNESQAARIASLREKLKGKQ